MHGHRAPRSAWLTVQSLLSYALAATLLLLLRCSWPPVKMGKEREVVSNNCPPPSATMRSGSKGGPSESFCSGALAAAAAREARSLIPMALPDEGKYLISSVLYFGRISNIKISLLDMIGASLESHRAFVVPEISECAVDGIDRTFGGLFNDALPLTRRIRSLSSFDASACNGSVYFVNAGPFKWEGPKDGAFYEDGGDGTVHNGPDENPNAVEVMDGRITSSSDVGTKGFLNIDAQRSGPLHKNYFAPGQLQSFSRYALDPLFFEKIIKRTEKCVIFGKNFQAANWERFPSTFVRSVRGLAPAAPIYYAAIDFLARHGLAGGAGGCPRGRPTAADALSQDELSLLGEGKSLPSAWGTIDTDPSEEGGSRFLAIHLRMGDFLTITDFSGFGSKCNMNPSLLIDRVKASLAANTLITRVVVATDDFSSKCYTALAEALGEEPGASAVARHAARAESRVVGGGGGGGGGGGDQHTFARPGGLIIPVRGGSGYKGSSCSAALFDQEVLGHSAEFFGESGSSFSEAIHRIRSLRCGAPALTTIWL
jgi:hypothetical protein